MKKYVYTLMLLLFLNSTMNAQVLWSDDFDNLIPGPLTTDPTGTLPGQGGWYTKYQMHPNPSCNPPIVPQTVIVPESGRGNVLRFEATDYCTLRSVFQKDLDVLWQNRTAGNNILMLELDYFLPRPRDFWNDRVGFRIIGRKGASDNNNIDTFPIFFIYHSNLTLTPSGDIDRRYEHELITYSQSMSQSHNKGVYFAPSPLPFDDWISIQLFWVFDSSGTPETTFIYIPALGIMEYISIDDETGMFGILELKGHTTPNVQGLIKFDNIKMTALNTLPSYLGVTEALLSAFTVFPNPAADIVTVTSSENTGIEMLTVYDLNGKIVKSQKGSNENEVQLHIGNLAQGTYFLHIQTREGTAVEKIVKK